MNTATTITLVKTALAVLLARVIGPPATTKAASAVSAGPRTLGPPFVPGRGPTSAAWREEAITRANELEGLATWIEAHPGSPRPPPEELLRYVREHLEAVRLTAANERRDEERLVRWPRRAWASAMGAPHERALGNLDAVEATLLRLAPDAYLCGEMPSLLAHVNRFLPRLDPRRARVDGLAAKAEAQPLTETERSAVIAALHAANSQRRRDLLRVRNFRNIMLMTAALLVPLAGGLAVIGILDKTAIPLCFYPEELAKVVCPTQEEPVPAPVAAAGTSGPAATVDVDGAIDKAVRPGDIALVEVIGVIAAAVASVAALRDIKGTSTPYSLAVALALVKIPLGALTAVLGIVLMAGAFVPGLSALDTSAQILGWALIFGFTQQLLTRLVDARAQTLLENVGGRGATGDRERSAR